MVTVTTKTVFVATVAVGVCMVELFKPVAGDQLYVLFVLGVTFNGNTTLAPLQVTNESGNDVEIVFNKLIVFVMLDEQVSFGFRTNVTITEIAVPS